MRNSNKERALYEKLSADPRFRGSTPTKSFLRQHVLLADGTATYDFSFSDGGQNVSLPQRLLNIKDVFWAYAMGLFILVEKIAKPGSGVLFPYPNIYELRKSWIDPTVAIDTVTASNALVEDMETIYNGTVSSRKDQNIVFDGMPSAMFRHVPQTQFSAINDQDQREGGLHTVEIEPNLVLSGRAKNQVRLEIPSWAKTIDSNNVLVTCSVVAVLEGFVMPGTADQFATASAQ